MWTYALIFGGFSLLAYSRNDDCGPYVGLAIGAFLGFFWFFFNQWLYAQTEDMHNGFWKILIRNLIGLITALTLFYELVMTGRVLVYIFGWTQEQQARFFWVVGIISAIILLLINILAYGPFVHAIGFIVGVILFFIIAGIYYSHQPKQVGPIHH